MKYQFTCLYLLLLIAFTSCSREFDKEMERRESSSGVLKITKLLPGGMTHTDNAMRGERVILYGKVGTPGADVKVFIGGVEATIITRGQETLEVPLSVFTGDKGIAVADTFGLLIPEGAEIGSTSVYFTVNGAKTIPFPFIVKKPDILAPGKVTVTPLFLEAALALPENGPGRDGPIASATIAFAFDLGIDKAGAIYFIDEGLQKLDIPQNRWYPETNSVRKIANGEVTTLCGNGADEYATNMKDLRLKTIDAMKIADDGTIYLAVTNFTSKLMWWPDAGFEMEQQLYYNRILRINPATGNVVTVVGGTRMFNWNLFTNQMIVDGPADKAMIGNILCMELDKEGNLYFMDAGRYTGGAAVLRKVSTDGMVTTLAGRLNDMGEHTLFEADGITKEVVTGGSAPMGGSSDGFGRQVIFDYVNGIAFGGNGKLYLAQGTGSVMKDCIREFNPVTNEVSTVVGKPVNAVNGSLFTGTFKEVDTRGISSLDADFDGNILVGYNDFTTNDPAGIYKLDINKEVVYKIAGYNVHETDPTKPQPGGTAAIGAVSRIVFDQFGKLFVAYEKFTFRENIHFSNIALDRN